METTKEQAEQLIAFILATEETGSVTNLMVARVMDWLKQRDEEIRRELMDANTTQDADLATLRAQTMDALQELGTELANLQTQVGKSLQELRQEAEGLAAAVAAAARTARLATPQRVEDEAALEAAAAKAEIGQQFYVPEEG